MDEKEKEIQKEPQTQELYEDRVNERKTEGRRRKRERGFKKGILTGIIITLGVILLGAGGWKLADHVLLGGSYASGSVSEKAVAKKLDKINSLINKYDLYGDEIDQDKLIEGIYSGYAEALGDKYTVYYNEEETKALLESTSGTFSGIGASMTKDQDTDAVVIKDVIEDSPAEKAGMKAGDIIQKVDDQDVTGQKLDTIVSWIRGEKGTDVTLQVLRDGEKIELTATRDTVEDITVKYEMKDDNIGYIYVSEFDKVTYDQLKKALEDLEDQGMEGLVIDLRNNPGGNLDTVTDMLRLLLPKGTIVSTKDKNGNTEEITCDGTHEFTKPLAVLVNQYSASASEIFSGAVQDYGIGKIVGKTTYGKGVVQQLLDLGDGTYLKVTIAEYYTPNGRSINGKGVEPDVEVDYQYDEENPDYDNQLDKALETVNSTLNQ